MHTFESRKCYKLQLFVILVGRGQLSAEYKCYLSNISKFAKIQCLSIHYDLNMYVVVMKIYLPRERFS